MSLLPIIATLPEHESPVDESSPTNEPCEPQVEELKVYSTRQKSNTTTSQPCQAVNPISVNPRAGNFDIRKPDTKLDFGVDLNRFGS